MSAFDFASLLAHVGHSVEVVTYQNNGIIYNVAVECSDCCEVLLDYDNPVFDEEDENEFNALG